MLGGGLSSPHWRVAVARTFSLQVLERSRCIRDPWYYQRFILPETPVREGQHIGRVHTAFGFCVVVWSPLADGDQRSHGVVRRHIRPPQAGNSDLVQYCSVHAGGGPGWAHLYPTRWVG